MKAIHLHINKPPRLWKTPTDTQTRQWEEGNRAPPPSFSLSDSASLNLLDKPKDLKVFPSEESIEIPQRRIVQTVSVEGREEEGKRCLALRSEISDPQKGYGKCR